MALTGEQVMTAALERPDTDRLRARASRPGSRAGDPRWIGAGIAALVLGVVGMVAIAAGLADEPANRAGEGTAPAYPPGPLGELVRQGEAIVKDTPNHPWSKPFSGNALNCGSCHLDAGRDRHAASFIGVAAAYPAYSPREGRVITLEDRILNCFMRSCNGIRPRSGSDVALALTAYITWLSQGQPLAMNPTVSLGPNHVPRLKLDPGKADPARGRALYAEQCADCHGTRGQGHQKNPPVWGPKSYNAGAGLATLPGLASWLKVAMPLDDPSLTEDEARDLAAFLIAQPRPPFDPEAHRQPDDRQRPADNAKPAEPAGRPDRH